MHKISSAHSRAVPGSVGGFPDASVAYFFSVFVSFRAANVSAWRVLDLSCLGR